MNGSCFQPVKSGHQWAGGKASTALELWKGLGQTHRVATLHCGLCCLFLAESKPLGTSKRWERRSNGNTVEKPLPVSGICCNLCSCLIFTVNLVLRVTSLFLTSGSRWLTTKGQVVKLDQGPLSLHLGGFSVSGSTSLGEVTARPPDYHTF